MVRKQSYAAILAAVVSFHKTAGVEIDMTHVASSQEYLSGKVHARSMAAKTAQWDSELAAGLMQSAQYPELSYTPCIDGLAAAIPGDANNTFQCNNIDLYHFLSHADLGSTQGFGSSSWGWTSEDGREFVAIGQYDGTAFAEITSEGKLLYLGRLPQYDPIGSRWREIRTLGDLAIIGSEAIVHGVQIFDMKKLLDVDPASPTVFTQEDLTGHFNKLPVGRTHNIVVNEELGYAIAAGSVGGNETVRNRDNLPCRGGLIFINMTDPSNPTTPGCAAGDGYVHDAQCLVYRGPDARYQGRDICYGYNEDTLTIYDVTNKIGNFTKLISRTSYIGAKYIHQGAVLDISNQEFLVLDDELDERDGTEGPATNKLPITYIFDIRDLESPKLTGYYEGKTRSIDHNQYIVDGYNYQSNYGAGLRVLDVSSIPSDPTGAGVCEAGFFDIHPEDDGAEGGGLVAFLGTWSSYAYFKSGFIYINTIERGSFVVKMTSKTCQEA
ncbi:hypothetical protein J7T55_007945 [Diaporthe amygdali]|uniref:uncharacterized protein n=1 Tax=Phomopsis amygdali TaxID=1214568 RepID=UPI0022FF0C51|nr:uncharacterized protein J7T55_007945 [Diaporthe amygdali]KAJ0114111.1 hypothetical protein J7T55_007945 [Diaporthe amygdali]